METARIYARVSSDRQKQDNTISNQTRNLPTWCKSQNYELTGTYADEGKSASAGKLHLRGDFAKMLEEASRKEFDVLVVADLDRITRSNDWAELGLIFGPLQKAGIKIAGPNLPAITLGSSMSFMQLVMRITVAYEDNQKRVERFGIGKVEAAQRGELPQGRVPYGLRWLKGYRWKAHMGPLTLPSAGWSEDPEQAKVVREIYRRAVEGESAKSIGRTLERRDEKSPRGGRWDQLVTHILRSTYTRGEWESIGMPIKVPALVSDETWYAAQAALGVSKKRGLVQTKAVYLCEALGSCELCKGRIHIVGRQGNAKGRPTYRYYICENHLARRRPGIAKCDMVNTRVEKMDADVWAEIVKFFAQPRERILAAILKRREHEQAKAQDFTVTAANLAEQLTTLASKEGTYADMFDRDMLSPEVYRQKCAELTVRRHKLTSQLAEAQASAGDAAKSGATTAHLAQLVDELRVKVPKATQEERRDLARLLIQPGGVRFEAAGGAVVTLMFDDRDVGENAVSTDLPAKSVTLRVVA